MRLQPASSRAASCSFNFCSRRAVDIGVIELSHRGNKLPQQQRRHAADRRQWSAWTHPSELPAVLMLSALLRRPFLGFSVAPFPFCAPVDCFCVNDAARRAAVGDGLWDGRPPTHGGLDPHPHALETALKIILGHYFRIFGGVGDSYLSAWRKAPSDLPLTFVSPPSFLRDEPASFHQVLRQVQNRFFVSEGVGG